MTDSIPKDFVGGSKTGTHQNFADSYEYLEAVVSDEVYLEDLNMEDILYGMDTPFVYDMVSGMDSSSKDAKSNLVHFKHTDPDKIDSLDTAPDQAASPYAGSENVESRNVEFDDCEYDSNKSNGNEFHNAEEFYDNSQKLRSTLSAKVSDDDQPNQGVLEERVMFKRWLNEPVKDGPYVASWGGNTS